MIPSGGSGPPPVSSTHVHQERMFTGAPHHLPYTPNINIGYQAHHLIAPCMGFVIKEIQEMAYKTPVRTFVFNLMSQNGYNNQDFINLLITAVEYADYLCHANQVNPEKAVEQAARESAAMVSSLYAKRYASTFYNNMDPATQQEVDRWLQYMNHLKGQIEAHYKRVESTRGQVMHPGNNAPQYGMPYQQPQYAQPHPNYGMPQQPQYAMPYPQPQPQMMGHPQQVPMYSQPMAPQPQRMHPGMVASQQQVAPRGDMFQAPHMQPMQHPGTMTYDGTLKPNNPQTKPQEPTHPAVNQSMDAQGQYRDHRTPEQQAVDLMKNSHTPRSTGATDPNAPDPLLDNIKQLKTHYEQQTPNHSAIFDSPEGETPMNEVVAPSEQERPWDYQCNENGTQVWPFHLSPVKRTSNLDSPYSIAFDPEKQIKFYLMSTDGSVVERIKSYQEIESMDYLKHEINSTFRQKAFNEAPEAERVVPLWDTVVESEQVTFSAENSEPTQEQIDKLSSSKTIEVPYTFVSHGLEGARFKAMAKLKSDKLTQHINPRSPIQYYTECMIPLFFPRDERGEVNLAETIGMLAKIRDIETYHTELVRLYGEINDQIWHSLNDLTTKSMNWALTSGLDIRVTMDSFAADWDDFKDYLIQKHGINTTQSLIKTMNLRVMNDVVLGGYQLLDDAGMRQYLMDIDLSDEVREGIRQKALVLSQLTAHIDVPWNASDMSIVIDDPEHCTVHEKTLPQLHRAITAMIERADIYNKKIRHYYIHTRDNVTLEVKPGYYNAKMYLIRIV